MSSDNNDSNDSIETVATGNTGGAGRPLSDDGRRSSSIPSADEFLDGVATPNFSVGSGVANDTRESSDDSADATADLSACDCSLPELALAKDQVGPSRVQVLYCERCGFRFCSVFDEDRDGIEMDGRRIVVDDDVPVEALQACLGEAFKDSAFEIGGDRDGE